ncbi:hypothetical protein DL769_008188 [Monosporascus sp. CRB-8-3]|nr:hypothetical protein DL769_008188 [Monosporascus sp. CRB-8-3]
MADLNGVVVLPAELAERALPLMRKQVEADDRMAVEIKKGMAFSEAISRRNVQVAEQSDGIILAYPPGAIKTALSESGIREAVQHKNRHKPSSWGHATSDGDNPIRGSCHQRERHRQTRGRLSIAEHCCVALALRDGYQDL